MTARLRKNSGEKINLSPLMINSKKRHFWHHYLFIQPPKAKGMAKLLLAIPYYFNPNATLSLGLNVLNAELLAHSTTIVVLDNLVAH